MRNLLLLHQHLLLLDHLLEGSTQLHKEKANHQNPDLQEHGQWEPFKDTGKIVLFLEPKCSKTKLVFHACAQSWFSLFKQH